MINASRIWRRLIGTQTLFCLRKEINMFGDAVAIAWDHYRYPTNCRPSLKNLLWADFGLWSGFSNWYMTDSTSGLLGPLLLIFVAKNRSKVGVRSRQSCKSSQSPLSFFQSFFFKWLYFFVIYITVYWI